MTRLTLLAILVLLLQACSAPQPMETPTPVPTPTPAPTATVIPSPTPAPRLFRVIGYLTESGIPETVPYERLTHINYAFLLPAKDGSFQPFANSWKLGNLVNLAHAKGVKVLISVGGWGLDAQFETLAASPESRAVFVRDLVKFVADFALDGADIDWEYPKVGDSSQNFLTLLTELRAALPPDKLLTAAVAAVGASADGVPAEAFALLDFVNLMVYDGDPAYHASMDYATASLAYWQGRGLPPEKTVLGVPFYSRPGAVPYRKLAQDNPAAAQTDFFEYNGAKQNYNGLPTIRAKTRLALEKASGIMFWTLENDTNDDLSLLKAIDETIKP
jgi:GH18 family chitinase